MGSRALPLCLRQGAPMLGVLSRYVLSPAPSVFRRNGMPRTVWTRDSGPTLMEWNGYGSHPVVLALEEGEVLRATAPPCFCVPPPSPRPPFARPPECPLPRPRVACLPGPACGACAARLIRHTGHGCCLAAARIPPTRPPPRGCLLPACRRHRVGPAAAEQQRHGGCASGGQAQVHSRRQPARGFTAPYTPAAPCC